MDDTTSRKVNYTNPQEGVGVGRAQKSVRRPHRVNNHWIDKSRKE
jgi:hypothetical protein